MNWRFYSESNFLPRPGDFLFIVPNLLPITGVSQQRVSGCLFLGKAYIPTKDKLFQEMKIQPHYEQPFLFSGAGREAPWSLDQAFFISSLPALEFFRALSLDETSDSVWLRPLADHKGAVAWWWHEPALKVRTVSNVLFFSHLSSLPKGL